MHTEFIAQINSCVKNEDAPTVISCAYFSDIGVTVHLISNSILHSIVLPRTERNAKDMNHSDTDLKRTSRFSENRRNYMNSDGGYTYWKWDEELKREIPITINPGDEGVTQEWVILLDDIDHCEDLGDRYEEEARAYSFENIKNAYTEDGESADSAPDTTDLLPSSADTFETLYGDDEDYDPRIVELEEFIRTLPEDRQNLIYSFFGEKKYLREMADEENEANGTDVSYQAVQKRLKKAVKACCDHFGMPMPKIRSK